jgi:hypothetical protein
MNPIILDMLSIGDSILDQSQVIVTEIQERGIVCNEKFTWIGLAHFDRISRIPVTVENFPADGIVWCEEHQSCEYFHTRLYNGHYLPLIKDKQAFLDSQKPADEPEPPKQAKNCLTCIHNPYGNQNCAFPYCKSGDCWQSKDAQKPAGLQLKIGEWYQREDGVCVCIEGKDSYYYGNDNRQYHSDGSDCQGQKDFHRIIRSLSDPMPPLYYDPDFHVVEDEPESAKQEQANPFKIGDEVRLISDNSLLE